jgi:hypothetical protein
MHDDVVPALVEIYHQKVALLGRKNRVECHARNLELQFVFSVVKSEATGGGSVDVKQNIFRGWVNTFLLFHIYS